MDLDGDACYRALVAHDARFDGLFFVGVTTTGVYCRPVCRARTPQRGRCEFFRRAAEAERAGYRACFRCRPELAPGAAPVDALSRHVAAAVARIEAGALDDGSLDDLAGDLGISARHLRRAFREELGLAPVELAQSTRLAMAKQLVQGSTLPLAEVAFASGFASVRRFNAAFRERFGRTPSELRRGSASTSRPGDVVSLALGYRDPFAWDELLAFLRDRAAAGVELVGDGTYARTVRIGARSGIVRVRRAPEERALRVEMSPALWPCSIAIAARVRRLFDLAARPDVIAAHLARDASLRPLVRRAPGLRVPGAFDGFELALRAVLGQQISVRAATTLATRMAETFGDPIEAAQPGLERLTPAADRVARASIEELEALGLGPRAPVVLALSRAIASGEVALEAGADPDATALRLERIPGIGPWTAAYVAMRALGAPDAFPASDLALRRALGGASPRAVRERAERWRPWRAYAAMHVWNDAAGGHR